MIFRNIGFRAIRPFLTMLPNLELLARKYVEFETTVIKVLKDILIAKFFIEHFSTHNYHLHNILKLHVLLISLFSIKQHSPSTYCSPFISIINHFIEPFITQLPIFSIRTTNFHPPFQTIPIHIIITHRYNALLHHSKSQSQPLTSPLSLPLSEPPNSFTSYTSSPSYSPFNE